MTEAYFEKEPINNKIYFNSLFIEKYGLLINAANRIRVNWIMHDAHGVIHSCI